MNGTRDARAKTGRRPLWHRPLDLLYFAYFIFHIMTFICIDGQNFYPQHLIPSALKRVMDDYLRDSGDPFVRGLRASDPRYMWFTTSMYSSLVFQNPVFVVGAYGLYHNDRRVYPVMAAYALLAAVTTTQCLAHVLYGHERHQLTSDNVAFLVKSYVPFVILPLVMLVDTTRRSIRIIGSAPRDLDSQSSDKRRA